MENFALTALIEGLKGQTKGMVVRRIVQHHRNGFLFYTRSVRAPALKLSLDPSFPVIYLSPARPPVEPASSDFSMLLRKHLVGAQLLELKKPLSERIVELVFKTTLPAKELEVVYLVAELMPNSPNLFLLDRARRVLGWMHTPPPRRGLDQYEGYSYPSSAKTSLEVTRRDDPSWFDEAAFAQEPKNWLIRNLSGMGPLLAGEILYRRTVSGLSLPEQVRTVIARVLEPSPTAWLYSEKPLSVILERNDIDRLRKVVLSPMELDSLGHSYSVQTYAGMLELARFVSDELESRSLLAEAKAPWIRKARDRARRVQKHEDRLLRRQKQYSEADSLRATAQMLVASGAKMDQHLQSIDVTDYFGDNPRPLRIALDQSKTLRENIDEMFKQCRKAGRGIAIVSKQLARLKAEKENIQAELVTLSSIVTWDAWAAFRSSSGKSESRSRADKPLPAPRQNRRSLRLDGHEVFVGRSSRENDELTFKVATGDDFWLHVAGYTGSHVIVKNPAKEQELERSVLLRAAQLAAYYSQARNSSKVEVHYTRRKFVSKPRKAKPGLVQLREFKTVTVEPHNWIKTASQAGSSLDHGHRSHSSDQ